MHVGLIQLFDFMMHPSHRQKSLQTNLKGTQFSSWSFHRYIIYKTESSWNIAISLPLSEEYPSFNNVITGKNYN